MIADVWQPLPGFPGYRATTDGRVMGLRGKELRAFRSGTHSVAVNLTRDGEVVRVSVKQVKRMLGVEV